MNFVGFFTFFFVAIFKKLSAIIPKMLYFWVKCTELCLNFGEFFRKLQPFFSEFSTISPKFSNFPAFFFVGFYGNFRTLYFIFLFWRKFFKNSYFFSIIFKISRHFYSCFIYEITYLYFFIFENFLIFLPAFSKFPNVFFKYFWNVMEPSFAKFLEFFLMQFYFKFWRNIFENFLSILPAFSKWPTIFFKLSNIF